MRGLITITWLALTLIITLYLFWNLDTESIGGHDRPYHVLNPLR